MSHPRKVPMNAPKTPESFKATGTPPSGESVLAELNRNGVRFVVTVPDWVQIPLHRALQRQGDKGIRTLNCCTEHEAFMIAGGLHIGGSRSAVVIQQQGLYAGLNALRGIGLDTGLPMVLLMGQFGREVENFGKSPRDSTRRIVRLLEPLLETLEIPYFKIESADQVARISEAYELAEKTSSPVAIIFDRNLSWN